jgi:hypothetical protein
LSRTSTGCEGTFFKKILALRAKEKVKKTAALRAVKKGKTKKVKRVTSSSQAGTRRRCT